MSLGAAYAVHLSGVTSALLQTTNYNDRLGLSVSLMTVVTKVVLVLGLPLALTGFFEHLESDRRQTCSKHFNRVSEMGFPA